VEVEKELMILVGPIGAGKTTFCQLLENDSSVRISQDEMGRKVYLQYFNEALEDNVPRIIIDRMNFNKDQRKRFIEPAREAGYVITIFDFEWDWDECLKRVTERKGHPTVRDGDPELAEKILTMFQGMYEAPTQDEYDNCNKVEMIERM